MSSDKYTGPWAPGMLLRTSLHGSHPLGLGGGLPAGTEWRLDGVTEDDAEDMYWDLLSEGRCSEDEPCALVAEDPATIGALAGVVRKLYNEARICAVSFTNPHGTVVWAIGWYEAESVTGASGSDVQSAPSYMFVPVGDWAVYCPTEHDAWLAAYHDHPSVASPASPPVRGDAADLDAAGVSAQDIEVIRG